MPQSKNMARLAEDMKRELIAVIGAMKDPRVQGFLTVMRVEVAPDLSLAKVHISRMGAPDATAEAAPPAMCAARSQSACTSARRRNSASLRTTAQSTRHISTS